MINPTLNLLTMKWLPCPTYNYEGGPILFFKGDPTAQAAETSQLAFNQQLMSIFQAQYGNQTGVLNYLKQTLEPQIQKPQGYTPAQLAAMRTSASDTVAQQYQNAQVGANAAAVRTGGSALPSGVSAMIESSIAPQAALEESRAQNQITQANANLQQQNYWNSISALSGTASQLNPLGYAQAPISGGNTVAGLSGAVTAASQPTWLQALGGVVGGATQGLLGNPSLKL